jgi:3-deoxy-D-manno-octulosonate 8-phosphate phosphatase (KDO 8-P phosphatase)
MVSDRLKTIRILILDVDGVLTTGEVMLDSRGREIKRFDVKDGLGIRLLQKAGIQTAIATGRRSEALRHRCRELGIELLYDGLKDKVPVVESISTRTGLTARQMAFAGDDLPDLPLMRRVGLAIAVADAHPLVRNHAQLVTRARGGRGAVREICEHILKAQGLWDDIIKGLVT